MVGSVSDTVSLNVADTVDVGRVSESENVKDDVSVGNVIDTVSDSVALGSVKLYVKVRE